MDSILIDIEAIEKVNSFNSLNLYDLALYNYVRQSYPSCEFLLNIIINSKDKTNYTDAVKLLIIGKDNNNLKCYCDNEYVKVLKDGSALGIKECGKKLGQAYQEGLLGLPKDPNMACKYYMEVIKAHSNKTYGGVEEFKDFGFAYSQITNLSKKLNTNTLDEIKQYVDIE